MLDDLKHTGDQQIGRKESGGQQSDNQHTQDEAHCGAHALDD
jgi:hypothetical protein